MKTTRKLLAQLVEIWNREGLESQAVKDFIESHKDNEEFVSLAGVAIRLKRLLASESNGS